MNILNIGPERSIQRAQRRGSSFLRREMTIVNKPETKNAKEALQELKNSSPVSEFERIVNKLFLCYIDKGKRVSRDHGGSNKEGGEAAEKRKIAIEPKKAIMISRPESPLQKYLRHKSSGRGSPSPKLSSFKKISRFSGKRQLSHFNKNSPKIQSTKKIEFTEIECEIQK